MGGIRDYRLTVRIRNNRILKRIEDAGYESASEFCRAFGLVRENVSGLITMRLPGRGKRGEWISTAVRMAAALNCSPEDLFNERQEVAAFDALVTDREVDESALLSFEDREVRLISDDGERRMVQRDLVRRAVETEALTERERDILCRRFGLGGAEQTLAEAGEPYHLTRERVRQIEMKAIRKIRAHLRETVYG